MMLGKLIIVSLLLPLCACQGANYKHYTPDYPQANPEMHSAPNAETPLALALEQYASDGSTQPLRAFISQYPAEPSTEAVVQLLLLNQRFTELLAASRQSQQQLATCRAELKIQQQEAAQLQQQLEALAKSVIQQEKRLP